MIKEFYLEERYLHKILIYSFKRIQLKIWDIFTVNYFQIASDKSSSFRM